MSAKTPQVRYEDSVFINCPFDDEYLPIFRAVVFTVAACGFVPRCTLEHDDASHVRIEKIYRLIEGSAHGIHDVSRTELDAANRLPRFNMPLELGVFLGAKRFGRGKQTLKRCLILDRDRYRFQRFISDIAGQDIKAHGYHPEIAVKVVRDWLRNAVKSTALPGGKHLAEDHKRFNEELPGLCDEARLDAADLAFADFYELVLNWLATNR